MAKKSTDELVKNTKKLRDEFKECIAKGNVLDLAVGMVLGSAFTNIVTSVVNDLIMPVVGLLVGGIDFTKLEIEIPNFFGLADAAHIQYGNLIQAIVNFLVIAFTLFLVLKNIELMKERAEKQLEKARGKKAAEEEKKAEEKETREQKSDEEVIALLTEIRDSLAKKK